MTIEVIDVDGAVIEFPDGTPQEQMASVMRSRSRAPQRTQAAPSAAPFPTLEESAAAIPQSAALQAAQRPLAPLTAEEQASRRAEEVARQRDVGQFRTPLSPVLPDLFDPGERARVVENVGGAARPWFEGLRDAEEVYRGAGRRGREALQPTNLRRMADATGQAVRQAPDQAASAITAAPGAFGDWFEGLRAAPAVIEERNRRSRELGPELPAMAGDLWRTISYGPGENVREGRRQLFHEREMAAQGFGTPGLEQELIDEVLRERGWAGLNLAGVAAEAPLIAQGARQLPRLLPRGAPRPGGARPGARPSGPQPPPLEATPASIGAGEARARARVRAGARPPPTPPPVPPPLPPAAPPPLSPGRQAHARAMRSTAEQARAAEAEAAPLEAQFGPLTRGERRGVASDRLDEENMRLGMGSAQAQSTMRGFDARRAQQIRENAMRLVTRGRPALSQDVGEAGVVFADELRTARENMAAQRTQLYEEARPLLERETITPSNDMLSATLEATARQNFTEIPTNARAAVAQFEDEVRAGTATQARLEEVRKAFNRDLSTAARQGNARDEYVIGELIGALDDWQLARLANPEARRAITEARGMHRELQQLYAEQNRVELSTGHVGRTDLGGRAVERVLNEDRTGEQIIDGMIGRGGRPTPQTLGAVKRVIEIDNAIQYTNRGAESGVRVPGRPKVGGRTAGERRIAADDPAALPTAQNPLGGMEQPKPMTQALREGFWHRMLTPMDEYLARVEATGVGREGGLLPARRMVSQLDNALNGSGREITALLYTERERAAMRQLLSYFKRLVPPAGANYSGSAIAVYRAMGRALESVANAIPGLGWSIAALRSAARDFASTVRAERAIAPVRPRAPRTAAQRRVQPPRRPSGPPRALSALGTGGAIGAGALLAAPGEAQAQEGSLANVRRDLQARRADLEVIERASRTEAPDDVKAAQRILRRAGLYSGRIDGIWLGQTTDANNQFQPQLTDDIADLERQEAYLSTRPTEDELSARHNLPTYALLGGAVAGHLAHFPGQWFNRGANALRVRGMNRSVTSGAPEQRAASMNAIYGRGGAPSETQPFSVSESGQFTPNRNVAPESSLFQPRSPAAPYLSEGDLLLGTAAAGEVGITGQFVLPAKERELEAAREALAEEKTAENYQRVEDLENEVANMRALRNAGMGLLGGQLARGAGSAILRDPTYLRPRPDWALIQRERAALNRQFSTDAQSARLAQTQARAQTQAVRAEAQARRAQAQAERAEAQERLASARAAQAQAQAARAEAQAETARLRAQERAARERRKRRRPPPTRES